MKGPKHADFEKFLEGLRQQRDELKLQLHLLKAEALDEWNDAEEKWKKLKAKRQQIASKAEKIVDDLEDVATGLGEEIKKGYERIRRHLK
jgi:predicted  nucleic acid-binding Zn-ribbon protein